MHAERLLLSICVPRLALTAQAIFLLERGQTRLNALPTTVDIQPVWVNNESIYSANIAIPDAVVPCIFFNISWHFKYVQLKRCIVNNMGHCRVKHHIICDHICHAGCPSCAIQN